MKEDMLMGAVLLTRNHMQEMRSMGIGFARGEHTMAFTEDDIISLLALEHMLIANGHDIGMVITNLDDIICWAPFLYMADAGALTGVDYMPIVSLNAPYEWHLSPQDFCDLLASFGVVDANALQAREAANKIRWWLVLMVRDIQGVVLNARLDSLVEYMEEEE